MQVGPRSCLTWLLLPKAWILPFSASATANILFSRVTSSQVHVCLPTSLRSWGPSLTPGLSVCWTRLCGAVGRSVWGSGEGHLPPSWRELLL